MKATTYDYEALCAFATALGERVGLPPDRARMQSEILLEADLMGHTTHGLALLPGLLKAIESGAIRAVGEPEVLSDRGSTVLWDANALPGTWLLCRAITEASARIQTHPVVTFVMRSMSHIGALGAYLRQATEHGLMITIMNSDPGMRTVAPAGGMEGQLAPNPHVLRCQWLGETLERGSASAAREVAAGCGRQRHGRPRNPLRQSGGNDAAPRRIGTRTQRLCAEPDGRCIDDGSCGGRPGDEITERGNPGISPAHRSRGVRRRGSVQARGRLSGESLPRQQAPGGSGRGENAGRHGPRHATRTTGEGS